MQRILATLPPALIVLSGCAAPRVVPPATQPGFAIQGTVSLAGQPVAGARIFLLTPGNDLLGDSLRSAPDGSFSIPSGSYACIPGSSLYLYALGGQPASRSGLLALAQCSSPTPKIQLRDPAGLTQDASGDLWITGFGSIPLFKFPNSAVPEP